MAQTTITLTRISQTEPVQANCDVEVGVPLANKVGIVSDVMIQNAVAHAADQAARFALGKRPATSAELCALFVGHMRSLLQAQIPGATVQRFILTGIPRTKFVPE